ncbi:hypothetical protein QYE76_039068 [Lolium multiflorum]|uniref:Uncharacterized protein n=1 Tax=Lolium multiflorum TaxID=4521 RepID=A0AAD8T978_LOLMU|nr:hypothetical protein QYE76_039068 [Lolium multiflorum]
MYWHIFSIYYSIKLLALLPECYLSRAHPSHVGLDKGFGFSKHFFTKYKPDYKVGRGQLGCTCSIKAKKASIRVRMTIKVIPKANLRSGIYLDEEMHGLTHMKS